MKVKIIKDTNAEYHSSKLLGTSTVVSGYDPRTREINLARVKAYLDEIEAPSAQLQRAFDFGTVAHAAILEQSMVDVVAVPSFEVIKGKTKKAQDEEWLAANPKKAKADMPKHSPIPDITIKSQVEEFKAAHPANYYLTESEFNSVKGMFDVFASHSVASRLVSNSLHTETSFYDEENGMKAKPDLLGETDKGGIYICNFKTISDLSKAVNHIFFHSYDIRAAQEIKLVEKALGKKVDEYVFLFQEKKAPYTMRYIRLSKVDIEAAMIEHTRIFNTVRVAMADGYFPQPSLQIEESSINRVVEDDFLSEVAS